MPLLSLAAGALLLGGGCSKLTQNLEDDVLAAQRHLREAEKGDLESMVEVAWHYVLGTGVEPDREEALKWFRAAAEGGSLTAQRELADLLTGGEDEISGSREEMLEAVKWYRLAATQGDGIAAFNLALLYEDERGLGPDYDKAMEWYRKSAERGDEGGMHSVGLLYEEGAGVEQSDEIALEWFQKSADEGYADAQFSLGLMSEEGRAVAQSFTDAIDWYRKAAENASPSYDACNHLAWVYATCAEEKLRDGRKAVRYALRAVSEEPDNPAYVDTLAAAYARSGWFEDAVDAQRKAIALLPGDEDLDEEERAESLAEMEARLELYLDEKAYAEASAGEE